MEDRESPSLEIGIPTNKSIEVIMSTARRAMSLAGVTSIHISINRNISENETRALKELDSRIRISHRERDIGLYGNFRYLINSCTSVYFSYLADDDCHSSDAFEDFSKSRHQSGSQTKLFVQSYVLSECRFEPTEWFGDAISGISYDSDEFKLHPELSLNPEPSWIFGIWDAEYLRRIFPRMNFDWLDQVILARVILEGKAAPLNNSVPQVIGTWQWLNKKPTSVNGNYHRAFGWTISYLILLIRLRLLDSGIVLNFWAMGMQPRLRHARKSRNTES